MNKKKLETGKGLSWEEAQKILDELEENYKDAFKRGKKMSSTKEILKSMFLENTGSHPLDSGDAYGRNWEANKELDLDALPDVTVEFSVIDGKLQTCPVIETYKALQRVVTYSPEAEFWDNKLRHHAEESGESGLGAILELIDLCVESECICPIDNLEKYLYGDNSYNSPQFLSQQIQFCLFNAERDFIALQVHGGCDVRAGYSEARIFEIDSAESVSEMFTGHLIREEGDGGYLTNVWVYDSYYQRYEHLHGNGFLHDFPAIEGNSLDDWVEGSILVVGGRAYSPFEKGRELVGGFS